MINVTVEGRTCTKEVRVGTLRSNKACYQSAPESYKTNTDTEQFCLCLVSDFLSNVKKNDDGLDQPAFIVAENEFGIKKCVCTTLKPQLLPCPALYNLDECSAFISQCMEFEPLENPCEPPICIPSPSQVLSWGVGDCFDLSILLASFLIGSGYDAYVVFGIAPKWICSRDRSNLKFQLNGSEKPCRLESELSLSDQSIQNIIKRLESFTSDAEFGESIPEIQSDQEYYTHDNDEATDLLHGKRIHCWVAVKENLRSPPDSADVFVEPSTGEKYSIQEEYPYIRIFALWNNQNYWINRGIDGKINDLDMDCSNRWESVFFNSSLSLDTPKKENDRKSFDPPFSWVKCLSIPQESFPNHPNGQREIFLDRAKIEYFSEGLHKQGLIKRITMFNDKSMLEVASCIEIFGKKRTDNLVQRVRLLHHQSIQEDFSPTHSYSLSKWIEKYGHRRIIEFREKGRTDGLVIHDELFGKLLVHTYSGRRDRLYERTSYLELFKGTKDKQKGHFIIPTGDGNATVTKIM